MNNTKCTNLKAELAAEPEPQIVSVQQFFDGNDDPGSIGCNLMDHPGVATFRDILAGLLHRPDVLAVYAYISELDPGEGCWPFTDTILVVGMIPAGELRDIVSTLEPDEVLSVEDFGISSSIVERHDFPILVVWWD
jgi:hypothetical protein